MICSGCAARPSQAGARYVVIGGRAVIPHGFGRATGDVDWLADSSALNFDRTKAALLSLPDGAIKEAQQGELDQLAVIRLPQQE
jgi:hypothetical protein